MDNNLNNFFSFTSNEIIFILYFQIYKHCIYNVWGYKLIYYIFKAETERKFN